MNRTNEIVMAAINPAMPETGKVIHDSVHGSITLPASYERILSSPEMQRMGQIHQLGLANLVFPGANHTRLEHMLGTFRLAARFSQALGITGSERDLLLVSALVHDVGHPPFSHTFEDVLKKRLRVDHMELTARIILGEVDVVPDHEKYVVKNVPRIAECVERMSVDPGEVAMTVMKERGARGIPQYVTSLIHGPVDVDQIDYLMRDSYFTGVAPGRVDADRIISTSRIIGSRMVVRKSGVPAIEGLIVSRALMNSAVYFHRTVRIAEMMLTKAVSMLDSAVFEDVFKDTDASLSERLIRNGGFPRDIALRLKYRRLYKTALLIDMDEMDAGQREAVSSLVRKGRLSSMEDEICDELGVEHGSVIIDAAQPEYLSGAGIKGKTVVPIMDESGVVRPLTRLSSIARAVQQHSRQEWGLMVACEKRLIPRASAIARRTIFS